LLTSAIFESKWDLPGQNRYLFFHIKFFSEKEIRLVQSLHYFSLPVFFFPPII
jgi:hypothetical protein